MHHTLVKAITAAGGGSLPGRVLHGVPNLLMPGFLTSRFSVRIIFIIYVGAGFYISGELADFDVPTASDELRQIVKIARIMLQVKNVLRSTVNLFTSMKESAEKERFVSGRIPLVGQNDFVSPKKPRAKKTLTN